MLCKQDILPLFAGEKTSSISFFFRRRISLEIGVENRTVLSGLTKNLPNASKCIGKAVVILPAYCVTEIGENIQLLFVVRMTKLVLAPANYFVA